MGNELHDGEDLFARLVTGNFPDDLSGISPRIYKAALIDAIKVLENEMRYVKSDMPETELYLEYVQNIIRNKGKESEEDIRALIRSLLDDIDSDREKIKSAEDLLKSCESRLLDLLEEYPELND